MKREGRGRGRVGSAAPVKDETHQCCGAVRGDATRARREPCLQSRQSNRQARGPRHASRRPVATMLSAQRGQRVSPPLWPPYHLLWPQASRHASLPTSHLQPPADPRVRHLLGRHPTIHPRLPSPSKARRFLTTPSRASRLMRQAPRASACLATASASCSPPPHPTRTCGGGYPCCSHRSRQGSVCRAAGAAAAPRPQLSRRMSRCTTAGTYSGERKHERW